MTLSSFSCFIFVSKYGRMQPLRHFPMHPNISKVPQKSDKFLELTDIHNKSLFFASVFPSFMKHLFIVNHFSKKSTSAIKYTVFHGCRLYIVNFICIVHYLFVSWTQCNVKFLLNHFSRTYVATAILVQTFEYYF
jgi:hypothetical protein